MGEICCRSPAVMRGYWRSEQATADTIRDGWLHTGDVGYLDEEGYLFIVDRKKDVIIRGGFNVYPRDVEDALLEHPAVTGAGVVGRPDERHGEEVVAFVSLSEPADGLRGGAHRVGAAPDRRLQVSARGAVRRRDAAHRSRQARPQGAPRARSGDRRLRRCGDDRLRHTSRRQVRRPHADRPAGGDRRTRAVVQPDADHGQRRGGPARGDRGRLPLAPPRRHRRVLPRARGSAADRSRRIARPWCSDPHQGYTVPRQVEHRTRAPVQRRRS